MKQLKVQVLETDRPPDTKAESSRACHLRGGSHIIKSALQIEN